MDIDRPAHKKHIPMAMMGMFYDRRSSDTAQKAALVPNICAAAIDNTSKPNSSDQANEKTEPEEKELDYNYSEQRVCLQHYEYVDTASSLVGHGSYGTVFKGLDHRTNQIVAVKKMARINVKPDELEAMKRVSNPHLVSLIDICDEMGDEITYLVMELCHTDLDRHLRWKALGGQLEQGELKTLIRSIATGYFALYEKHIVHRDIKPQNILLNYDSNGTIVTAKLTDFGVSRVLAEEGKLCNVAGTLFFMSPEVGANLIKLCEYDHKADMWSVGCVIYECHTGHMPFNECSLCRLFLNCAGGNYEAYELPSLPDYTDDNLQLLIASLLEVDRDKRLTPRQFYTKVVLNGSDPGISSSSSNSSLSSHTSSIVHHPSTAAANNPKLIVDSS